MQMLVCFPFVGRCEDTSHVVMYAMIVNAIAVINSYGRSLL